MDPMVLPTNIRCVEWRCRHVDLFYTVVYYYLAPVYFALCVPSHVIVLSGLYRSATEEGAYFYQVATVASQTAELFSLFFYCASRLWFNEAEFRTRSYWCTWIMSHLGAYPFDVSLCTSAMLVICTSADRLMSLRMPIQYRFWPHKSLRLAAVALSIAASVSVNGFALFNYRVVSLNETYDMDMNRPFVGSLTGRVWVLVQNVFLLVALIALIAISGLMMRAFRRRTAFVQQTSTPTVIGAKFAQRKRQEFSLFVLTCWQCLFTGIHLFDVCIYYTLLHFFPLRCGCKKHMVAPLVDGIYMVSQLLDFYLCFAVSRQFRAIVLHSPLWCCGGTKQSKR